MTPPDVPVLGPGEEADVVAREDCVLVAYCASWCGYCRRFMPLVEDLAARGAVKVVVGDVTDDDDPRWHTAQVDVVPTLVLYEKGAPVARLDGMPGMGIPRAAFERFVTRHVTGGAEP